MTIADHRLTFRLLLLCAAIFLQGCASTPAEPGVLTYQTYEETLSWPSPPEIPRYRFAGQLTGEGNFVRSKSAKKPGIFKRVFSWVTGIWSKKKKRNVLQRPQTGVTDAQGRIFVTDVSKQAVIVFDKVAGRYLVWNQAEEFVNFQTPIGIALRPDGGVFVADAELAIVAWLDKEGNPVSSFGQDVLVRPTGLALDVAEGHIYVADTGSHDIKVFDETGKLLKVIGQRGEKEGEFNYPTYLHFANDKLYVSDRMNARIQVLSKEGDALQVLGRRGRYVGDTPHPKGVATDSTGNVYVIESFHDYMLVYNDKGELLLPIGGTGQGAGQFYLPAGVWLDDTDRIYVADMFNGRVVVFDYLGAD